MDQMRNWIGVTGVAALAAGSALRRDDGQTLIEYALILVLIAVVVIVVLTVLGGTISSTLYGNISDNL